MVVSPNNNINGTSVNGTTLPTCDPSTQPALAPNFAQLDVTIAPGSSKDVDSFLCTRGTTGGATYGVCLGQQPALRHIGGANTPAENNNLHSQVQAYAVRCVADSLRARRSLHLAAWLCRVLCCCCPSAVASSNFDIALSVDLTGSFTDDLPIIKGLAPSLWSGLAAAIPSERPLLTVC